MSKNFVINAVTNVKSLRDYTAEEQADYDARMKILNDNIVPKKLEAVRKLRDEKLKETDYLALSDVVLSDAWKVKRKSWRDIPQDFTTESQYDSLLARDEQGKLTHLVWSKP
tara:strand:+ start:589 stop:924 length:336 start_codon:yes stop_codon:yes gene_type:complete